jgi:signal transduction histidine kinase
LKLFPKLALSVSFLLIGLTVILTGSFYWAEQRQIRHDARLDQENVLGNLVHIAQEAFLTNDDLLLVKYTRWIRPWHPAMTSASVVDTHGAILSHSEPDQIGRQVEAVDAIPATRTVVLSAPIRQGTHWIGTASVAFSQNRLDDVVHQRLRLLQSRLFGAAAWALILGFVLSFVTALSWTHPIKLLAHAAEQIGQGQWNYASAALETRQDELGTLAHSFRKMTDELQQLDQMKEDFVSAVTHELRSPLGAIESYLNLIADELHEGIPTAAWENYLERLRINTQRLTRFINDLLDVAALERGKLKLDRSPVNMILLAQDVVGLFALKLKEKHISYQVLGPAEVEPVNADADKIRHVLTNLVSNAIKFTPPGGHVLIRIEPQPLKHGLLISVSDTGVGIAEADQMKIFSKFEQVVSARKVIQGPKGTGLGLAISKALVELHGQTLNVKSRLGEGSTFFFSLPTVEA